MLSSVTWPGQRQPIACVISSRAQSPAHVAGQHTPRSTRPTWAPCPSATCTGPPCCVSVTAVTVLQVPYHLDEYLPELDLPLRADKTITADLPAGPIWGRLSALYTEVAGQVAQAAGRGTSPVVLSGDCTTPTSPALCG